MFTEPDDWDEDDDELILDPWGEPDAPAGEPQAQ